MLFGTVGRSSAQCCSWCRVSVGYALLGVSGLVVTAVMLRSRAFSKATAYCGMTLCALGVIPPTVGTVGVILSLLSLAPLVPHQILLARRPFQLADE
jgi:hypothetical protein